jgi:hypothetical protein
MESVSTPTMKMGTTNEEIEEVRHQRPGPQLLVNVASKRIVGLTTCTLAHLAWPTLFMMWVCNPTWIHRTDSLQFSHIQLGNESLTHTLPKGKDMYSVEDTTYPFPIFPQFSSLDSLVKLLLPREELFSYLDLFQRRAQSCSFPEISSELPIPKADVAKFLDDGYRNAENSPDVLALLFAMLATGMQVGQYDRSGGEWVEGAVEQSRQRSDVYSESICHRHSSTLSS